MPPRLKKDDTQHVKNGMVQLLHSSVEGEAFYGG